jgi:SEC-C motif
MTKIHQTSEDLNRHLQEQLGFLRRSADAYDHGYLDEAKRLSVTIRILMHDSRTSKSLLSQLGDKNRLFYDTAVPDEPGNLMPYGALIQMTLGKSGASYIPFLDDALQLGNARQVSFDEWWNRPIFRIESGQVLTRSDLIRSVADQDGGAHVDPALNEIYAKLSREKGMGWIYESSNGSYLIRQPELAAVRQIAHEVIKTFDTSYSKHSNMPEGSIVFAGGSLRESTPDEIAINQRQKMQPPVTPGTVRRQGPKIGRNDTCPCGSGIKFKKCHGRT